MRNSWRTFAEKLEGWQEEIIETACASEEVRALEYGSALLRYLAGFSAPHLKAWRSGEQIHENAFGPNSRGPSNLPAYLRILQDALDRFYNNVGSAYELRVAIQLSRTGERRNPHQNAVEYTPNHGRGWYTRLFWKDYLPQKVQTLIAYGIPLFETNSEYSYFEREVYRNEEKDLEDRSTACYPFVALGEVLAMLELSTWLAGRGVKVKHKGYSRKHSANEVLDDAPEANGILLGTARMNGVLRNYQRYESFPFFLDDMAVMENVRDAEPKPYKDRNVLKGEHVIAHVLVSRRPGKRRQQVTMIASHHGRAIQCMAKLLTSEAELTELFETRLKLASINELPKEFQILFEVDIHDREQQPGAWRYVKSWFPTS